MKIFLLTHQRELDRQTNTGSLAVEVLGDSVEVVIWERTKPNEVLLKYIKQSNIALLYPTSAGESLSESSTYDAYVIIDSTWQEAQKIYNKSPYLHDLPCVEIKTEKPSVYSLRRNQIEHGLCTAEIVAEVLKSDKQMELALSLEEKLAAFIAR
jgi:DTW domain-containing protein